MLTIHPSNKVLTRYYDTLTKLTDRQARDEMNLRPAFQDLLTAFGHDQGWTLIPELRLANGTRPDGTLVDKNIFYRGFWEAKDPKDKLEIEIRKKLDKGYPAINTIFEDTQQAILYQNDHQELKVKNVQDRSQFADLLERFFNFGEPAVLRFEQTVEEFKGRIPDLAQALLARIRQERTAHTAFSDAFDTFHEICRNALNPQVNVAAIEEMLTQHLLTERLFRTIFDNPDFTRRNVIAFEIEKVIDVLTSRSFNRQEFLHELDRFYVALEEAFKTRRDWSEKQAFLNTVYERFFQGFAVKQADIYGIHYTPQEIVDFMVDSVDHVLQSELGTSLSSPGVKILDPCTGTGNFVVNMLQRLPGNRLQKKYQDDLYANEIMLLPYYIASLNIERAFFERTQEYLPFGHICFVDTLDMAAEGHQQNLWLSAANTDRINQENQAEITVIIGNPPYNMGQQNENDNNKNRRNPVLDKRINETYVKDSTATLTNKLYDPYVKFFRWATDKLGQRDGIVCFVSNNSFIDQIAFDGMRKRLLQEFTQVYHLDLHGNVRKNPKLSGTTHNVFGIQVGVGVTIAIRNSQRPERFIRYYRVPEMWSKAQKLRFLEETQSIAGIDWQNLEPDEKSTWLTEGMHPEFASFLPLGTQEVKAEQVAGDGVIFKTYSLGVGTNRDEWVYDFNAKALTEKMQLFIKNYNSEVFRWSQEGSASTRVDDFVNNNPAFIKWTDRLKEALQKGQLLKFEAEKIKLSLYRPFCKKYLYFDHLLNQRRYQQHLFFPHLSNEAENTAIWLKVGSEWPMFAMITKVIPTLLPQGGAQCFPFYSYTNDGNTQRENITDWALKQFQARYGKGINKWDIFYYVYAMLHHPHYRERYAENLKRELPRIPLAADQEAFTALVQTGKQLAEVHLNYEQVQEYPLRWVENRATPFSWHVTKMRLSPDKTAVVVNDTLTLAGIPTEVFQYRLGHRSALEWVIDQYQISTDLRSGITSDPNREDDSEYIVRLIGRVVTVSMETVRLVEQIEQKIILPTIEEEPAPVNAQQFAEARIFYSD